MGFVRGRFWVIGGLLLAAGLAFFVVDWRFISDPQGWYVAVLLFGMAVGASELIGRYRDAPFVTLWTPWAAFYAVVNAAAAVAAFWLIQRFDLRFGLEADDRNLALVQAMVAGFGSMAFFRSSLFTIKVGDTDVSVGPGIFFQVLLFATDRACDRERAWRRTALITSIMNGISFSAARDALPNFCFDLMQNLPAAEAQRVRQAVEGLAASANMRDADRVLSLGLILMNAVGNSVLAAAVRGIGPRLQEPAKIELAVFTKLQNVDFVKAFPLLADVCVVMAKFGAREEQQRARDEVVSEVEDFAANPRLDNDTKVVMLALSLQQRFGDGILEAALTQLGKSILNEPVEAPEGDLPPPPANPPPPGEARPQPPAAGQPQPPANPLPLG